MTTAEIADIAKLSEPAKALLRDDLSPSKYVDELEQKKLYKDAIQFLAHGLPPLICAQWACSCCHELLPEDQAEKGKEPLEAAEAWTAAPEDAARYHARDTAEKAGMKTPPALVAMGIFFSGGSVAPPGAPAAPPPPYAASKIFSGAIQLTVVCDKPKEAEERYKRVLDLSRETVKKLRG